jgi:pyruvate,water dikinase
MPAVVGVGNGTAIIRTGDNLKVDGDTGVVTILERAK